MKITKKWLEDNNACSDGKEWGLSVIGEGMELSDLLQLFDRADWLIWTLAKSKTVTGIQAVRLAVMFAESVLHIYEDKYPDDNRPRKAIEASIRYCDEPTEGNRVAANAAAYAAADAVNAASYAVNAAAYAASHAASYAARAAAHAAYAVNAAYLAGCAAAYAAHAAGKKHHKKMCALILARLEEWGK